MILNLIFLVIGVLACSTAVIFIKMSREHAILLSAYRLLVAAVALTPLYVRDLLRHKDRHSLREVRRSVIPGILLGVHFISWIMAARMTTAANASLIVNLVPVVMPFLLWFMSMEKITRGEIAGTVLAIVGTVLLSAFDLNVSRKYVFGDMLCFVSMVVLSAYLALGRRNRDFASTWLYVVPLYYVAGIFCLVAGAFFTNPIKPYSWREIWLILALAFIPTVAGHSILNYSMKHLRGQVVSIVNMVQFVFATVMAWLCLGERPEWSFYLASVMVVAGIVLAVKSPPDAKG